MAENLGLKADKARKIGKAERRKVVKEGKR